MKKTKHVKGKKKEIQEKRRKLWNEEDRTCEENRKK